MIVNLLYKFLFNFKINHNICVYNSKLINIKFLLILFDVEIKFAINNDFFVNISNTKCIRDI